MQCNMFYVNNRWLGGMMTNFKTVRHSVLRLLELEAMVEDGTMDLYSKKEQAQLTRERLSLDRNLKGVKGMSELPAAIFIIDPHKEHIAVREANKLRIPIVALVDTNCDPDPIDYVIPGNDDAIRSINLMCQKASEACQEGLMARMESGLQVHDGTKEVLEEHGLTSADREERYAEYRADPTDAGTDYGVAPATPAEPVTEEVDPSVLKSFVGAHGEALTSSIAEQTVPLAETPPEAAAAQEEKAPGA
jgi:ribosomal protein S2